MSDSNHSASPANAPRRIHAAVALNLLEVMRDRDRPGELLEDEDPTRTIPRRFGLSDVVDRQIRSLRHDARRGSRMTEDEVRDLFGFVVRRPDAAEVFHEVGVRLAGTPPSRWFRLLPRSLAFSMARGRARRRLRGLFGRPIGGFARGPFIVEGRSLIFVDSDPTGSACHLVSGFAEGVVAHSLGARARAEHSLCQCRGDSLCRWEVTLDEGAAAVLQVAPPSRPTGAPS